MLRGGSIVRHGAAQRPAGGKVARLRATYRISGRTGWIWCRGGYARAAGRTRAR